MTFTDFSPKFSAITVLYGVFPHVCRVQTNWSVDNPIEDLLSFLKQRVRIIITLVYCLNCSTAN